MRASAGGVEAPRRSLRPFAILWTGQAFSLAGSQLVQFALVWWITGATGSATRLAWATLAAVLPVIVIGPVAGALADRWNRKAVMIVADAVVALVTAGLAVLFWSNRITIWLIYGGLLIRATGAAFHWPAMQASTTLMVPERHLARVGGLNQALAGLVAIFVPPLGALALVVLPMPGVLAIDVLTAAVAIGCLLGISVPQPSRAQPAPAGRRKPSVWADLREGLAFIWNWKALLAFVLVGVVINALGQAAGSLTPLLVKQHFALGAGEFAWLQSAVGIGTVVGGVLLGAWGGSPRRAVTSLLALVLDGLAIVVAGLSPREAFLIAVGALFCVGLLEALVVGLNGAIGQAIIPPEMQGRVLSLIMSVTQLMAPLGLLVAGPLADLLGVTPWWVLTGLTISALGLASLCVPGIVHIEAGRETQNVMGAS